MRYLINEWVLKTKVQLAPGRSLKLETDLQFQNGKFFLCLN